MSSGGSSITSGSGYALISNTSDQLYLVGGQNPIVGVGPSDSASPIASTLQQQSVVAGTSNTAGVNLTIAGSKGTGTGAGGAIVFKTAPSGTTGSTQNAEVTAMTIQPNGGTAMTPPPTSITGTSGTASCSQGLQGTQKLTTCYLNAYANTGTAQAYTFPTAYSTYPAILTNSPGTLGSCGTFGPTTTSTVLTLPANAAMTAETCNIVLIGQ